MIRAIVVFAVVIVVIAEVRAQDGNGNGESCGFMQQQCSDSQCCNGFMCMQKGRENQPCGYFGSCGCSDGLECRRGMFRMRQCLKPRSTTTEPSISTDSSSSVTSFSTDSSSSVTPDSASTDMPTEMPTIEGN